MLFSLWHSKNFWMSAGSVPWAFQFINVSTGTILLQHRLLYLLENFDNPPVQPWHSTKSLEKILPPYHKVLLIFLKREKSVLWSTWSFKVGKDREFLSSTQPLCFLLQFPTWIEDLLRWGSQTPLGCNLQPSPCSHDRQEPAKPRGKSHMQCVMGKKGTSSHV